MREEGAGEGRGGSAFRIKILKKTKIFAAVNWFHLSSFPSASTAIMTTSNQRCRTVTIFYGSGSVSGSDC